MLKQPSTSDPMQALRLQAAVAGKEAGEVALPRAVGEEGGLKVDVPAGFGGNPADSVCGWFETIYANAEDDASRVPWADCRPNPMLVRWLNSDAPGLVRPGSRAVVVGCGLGDDVAELARRGYDVVGFDVSPTAVKWATRRHPGCAQRFLAADLRSLPARLVHRFDLVVEIYTLQSMDPTKRAAAAAGVAALCAARGVVLTVCRGRGCTEPLEVCDGPPYPLSCTELRELMEGAGLQPIGDVRTLMEGDSASAVQRLVATFTRR